MVHFALPFVLNIITLAICVHVRLKYSHWRVTCCALSERRLADHARQCQGSYQVDLDTVITLTRAIAGTARRVAGTALKLAVNKFDDAQRRSDVTNAVNKLKNSTCVLMCLRVR